jgi:tetraacyldisaccharide 4'-kinase
LFSASDFREVVSGQRTGLKASILRGVLRAAEIPYAFAMRRRNRAFDSGRREVHDVGVPVISVGNLTLGGTGKTPMVLWLARWFRDRGVRVALVSRGYKATAGSVNDEARELEQRLPDVPHLQNPDRVVAARLAVGEFDAQTILLDDAFQHRRIKRNLDIVLMDALEPVGFGHVFPRGTLREPLDGLRRADVVVLTRADMIDKIERAKIRGVVERYAPSIAWAECRHAPQALISSSGTEQPIHSLRGRHVAAFCGIGNPAGFRHTLDECGCSVTAWREFPDHYAYHPADIETLAGWAQGSPAEMIVCTHKDLVKLAVDELSGRPLRAITIGMEFLAGQEALESNVLAKCHASPTKVANDK